MEQKEVDKVMDKLKLYGLQIGRMYDSQSNAVKRYYSLFFSCPEPRSLVLLDHAIDQWIDIHKKEN